MTTWGPVILSHPKKGSAIGLWKDMTFKRPLASVTCIPGLQLVPGAPSSRNVIFVLVIRGDDAQWMSFQTSSILWHTNSLTARPRI